MDVQRSGQPREEHERPKKLEDSAGCTVMMSMDVVLSRSGPDAERAQKWPRMPAGRYLLFSNVTPMSF